MIRTASGEQPIRSASASIHSVVMFAMRASEAGHVRVGLKWVFQRRSLCAGVRLPSAMGHYALGI
eukprot:7078603-Alexandrium_andersonii.AAC.1